MKTELKAKFLQHLSQKKQDQGFTLIELLVVIIIIGILSAIALPSFLNQANKAKQSEAKTYVGSANRSQQAYYLEEGKFVTDVDEFGLLGLGIATETTNYKYGVEGQNTAGAEQTTHLAQPKSATLKAYEGGVEVGEVAGTGEATTLAVLCEGIKAPTNGGPNAASTTIDFTGDAPKCDAAYKPLDG
ncbi:MAG: type IV pilin-like G/H family protein [Coleofasciculus sp. G1-WW12-02]|uniref:type IV pilin-like G/H family protein n=1 Tax=Coleofasciculus sp. G1-WW12-02 TaxID=3068483 RepID=UPI0032F4EDA5